MLRFQRDKLMINKANATGVSVLDGSPLTGLSDLPPYRIEIRQFNSSLEAQIFVEGLKAAGVGNALVYDWNTGDIFANGIVILGRVTEEVADDTPFDERVTLVTTTRNDHDTQARTRQSERDAQKERLRQQGITDEAAAILGGMGVEADMRKLERGQGWLRISRGGEAFAVAWESIEGPYSISLNAIGLSGGWYDARPELEALAEEFDCQIDEIWMLSRREPVTSMEGLEDAAQELISVSGKLAEERKRLFHAAFVKATKMKSTWRRMMRAGLDDGIPTFVNRRLEKAHAGGVEIGPSDISTLLSVGWLERRDDRLHVTQSGRAAAGIPPEHQDTPTL